MHAAQACQQEGTKLEKQLESFIYAIACFVRSEFDDKMLDVASAIDRAQKIRRRLNNDLIKPCFFEKGQDWVPLAIINYESRCSTGYLTLAHRQVVI